MRVFDYIVCVHLNILSIYTIQDIIPIPSNVKYVLAKCENGRTFPKKSGQKLYDTRLL